MKCLKKLMLQAEGNGYFMSISVGSPCINIAAIDWFCAFSWVTTQKYRVYYILVNKQGKTLYWLFLVNEMILENQI